MTRFGGDLDTTGRPDLMATFDGPSRAVGCAVAIRDSLGELGVSVRIGAHIGEIERLNGEVVGVAADLATRVRSYASPGSR